MSILDKVKIGNSVQVNLQLSKDRLTKETIRNHRSFWIENFKSILTIRPIKINNIPM